MNYYSPTVQGNVIGPANRPPNLRDEPASVVAVFDHGESYRRIERSLAEVHYRAIPGFDAAGNIAGGLEHASVHLVNGALDGAIALCAALQTDVPKLLLSSDSSFEQRVAAARAGVDGYVADPIDPEQLSGWLSHFSQQQQHSAMSILVVDDDAMTSEVCAATLRKAGYTVSVAPDAGRAYEILQVTPIDLVLLDIQMPGVNGIELARIIRQSREHLSLPIVFLSGERDPGRQLEARKFGGDDFIIKPVSPKNLLSLVALRVKRAQELRSLIERDSLTGLLNHGRFKEHLSHELDRCRRTGSEISLAIIDLDLFKTVNDSYGHLVGDQVIRSLANLLTGSLRKIDILGRYGGEEFAIILLDTSAEQAFAVMEKLRKSYSEIVFRADRQTFSSTFSGGLCSSRTTFEPDGLIARADAALYAAKAQGRNRIVRDASS